MNKPYQRKGVQSNTQVGKDFEAMAQTFFAQKGIHLQPDIKIPIGINRFKSHSFDLGDIEKKVIVECKSHKWTETDNIPSAKITAWNQAMYFFYTAPKEYRKIMFVIRDFSQKRKETLGQYYVRTSGHLIPTDVEFWEFDDRKKTAERIK